MIPTANPFVSGYVWERDPRADRPWQIRRAGRLLFTFAEHDGSLCAAVLSRLLDPSLIDDDEDDVPSACSRCRGSLASVIPFPPFSARARA